MYSFEYTWPYEKVMGDIYLHQCPYCHKESVLTGMKERDFKKAQEEIKTILIMPCCHHKMTILKADDDYFWTTEALRAMK
jgi:hypothetical protein